MPKTNTKKKTNTLKLKFDTPGAMPLHRKARVPLTINKQYDLFINGNGKSHLSKKYFDTINPANEEKLSEVAEANAADVDKAVKAARNAYEKVWKKMPAKERAKYIFRIARMIQERARELAIIESLDGVNQFVKAAILMYRLLPIIFFIMQAGLINWNMHFPTGIPNHWV